MECSTDQFTYQQTGYFSDIVTDYLKQGEPLSSFYEHSSTEEGLLAARKARAAFDTDRDLLVKVLHEQYNSLSGFDPGSTNGKLISEKIELLRKKNTFTICTAHQPNIFTGYLYFIYKIVHAIKLSDFLSKQYPDDNFIPLFYMGSEDADLEELGKVFLNGEKLVWNTAQTGAVGRMNTRGLETMIDRIAGELSVQPHGKALVNLLRKTYLNAKDIQTASFAFLHELFAEYGLLVLIADHPELKAKMRQVFADDLFKHIPSLIVTETNKRLADKHKVQANPRDINLFYLKEQVRNRIEAKGDVFEVVDTTLRFTREKIEQELEEHPERFSPNVILRGLYQETILPNIAFIGGGGELAYWLELKDLFNHYGVPYPVQIVRNSFLFIDDKWHRKLEALGFETGDLFKPAEMLMKELVKKSSGLQVHLTNELRDAHAFYDHLTRIGGKIDPTLETHIRSLEKRMTDKLEVLEKKMLRAEKRKFSDQEKQLAAIRQALFPRNSLQERVDNFMPYYAKYGAAFIRYLYDASLTLEQKFMVCTIKAGVNETSPVEKQVR